MDVSSTDPSRPQARRKRQLNLVKCERCRYDKVDCAPKRRVWPNKCTRCITKDLPCSEGSRVERKSKRTSMSKHKSTVPVPLNDEIEDTIKFKDLPLQFYVRNLLILYHQNLTMALERLSRLKENTTHLFFKLSKTKLKLESNHEARLKEIYEQLRLELNDFTNALLAIDPTSSHLPVTLLPNLLAHTFTTKSATNACSICSPTEKELESMNDITNKFLILQNRLCGFIECEHDGRTLGGDDYEHVHHDMKNYQDLTKRLVGLIPAVLKLHSLEQGADMVELTGLYHPDSIEPVVEGHEQMDCLRRTKLHCLLDFVIDRLSRDKWDALFQIVFQKEVIKDMDEKDILDRTPLHMMCQMGWQEGVEGLLKLGANSDVRTIYGSLPLHYAAANGSAGICEMLLTYGNNRGNEYTEVVSDCLAKTPLDYARDKQLHEVVRVFELHQLLRNESNSLSNSSVIIGSSNLSDDSGYQRDPGLTTNTTANFHFPPIENKDYARTLPGDLSEDISLEGAIEQLLFDHISPSTSM